MPLPVYSFQSRTAMTRILILISQSLSPRDLQDIRYITTCEEDLILPLYATPEVTTTMGEKPGNDG